MDGEVAFVLHRRLARLYDDKLEEHKMAVASWQAVLNTDPYDDEALRALDRLYQKDQQWQTLIEVLRRKRGSPIRLRSDVKCQHALACVSPASSASVGWVRFR